MARQKIIKTGFVSLLLLFFAWPALADINTNNGYAIYFNAICSDEEHILYFDGDPDLIWQMFVSSTGQFGWSFQDTANDIGTSQTFFECTMGNSYKILLNAYDDAVFLYVDGVQVAAYGGITGLSGIVFAGAPVLDENLTSLSQLDRKLTEREISVIFFGDSVAGASEFLGRIAGVAISSGVSVADRALTNGFGIVLVFGFIIAFVQIYDKYVDKL